ncbi:SDR family NAD(P)-dependent oxidoreductase [Burkholderia pseudomallei]|uniref:SDR family NAD(P)-dependent oxidoreductase n=1 Tax=Burkholderia pseudomallei TaxID=28450 RepID=UPI000536DDE8|nr:glucose 1-dehydrogenase [Burkholderia pseudomallei]KGX30551.1 short chain dehydrogenase family protein [Burkholderia pseudomallei MSHR2138]
MSGLLKDKAVLITGAAAGIGRATAILAAKEGARILVSDVDEAGLTSLTKEIEKMGGTAEWRVVDVATREAASELVDSAVSTFGRLDGAFNNAGISGPMVPLLDYPDDQFARVHRVNLDAIWFGMKAQITQMLEHGAGAIVNTASVGGLVGRAGISAYVSSKHGVIGMTKSAALEYGSRNIRINAICPGTIRTHMILQFAHGDQKIEDEMQRMQPIGRWGYPEEVAECAVWLLSDRASLVHGHALVADGAFIAA